MDVLYSDSQAVTLGIALGTVLGPLLFLCFVNDITGIVSRTVRLIYADYILIIIICDWILEERSK